MNRKGSLLVTIILGSVMGALFSFLMLSIFQKNIGSLADWVSGLGSFSAVLTLVISQHNQKKKTKEKFIKSLPLFEINTLNPGPSNDRFEELAPDVRKYEINIGISAPSIYPLENLVVFLKIKKRTKDGSSELVEDKIKCSVGHVFPQVSFQIQSDNKYTMNRNYYIDGVKIICSTIDGTKICYQYENQVQRLHQYYDGTEWVMYHN